MNMLPMTLSSIAGCTDLEPFASDALQLLSDGTMFAAPLVDLRILLPLTTSSQVLCKFAASRAARRQQAAALRPTGNVAADAVPAPAVMPAAVSAAVPAAVTAGVAAAPRCASATEEAMLQELQHAEAAHYLAHQVAESLQNPLDRTTVHTRTVLDV
jgi:hypothetical protein